MNKVVEKIKNLDLKSKLLIVLSIALILSFIFRPNKPVAKYDTEIKQLHTNTELLQHTNDSLINANQKTDQEIRELTVLAYSNQEKINKTNKEITYYKNKLNETTAYVATLDANGVSIAMSDYLQRRSKNNN